MTLKAIIFDVDGTIANTEHDVHLKAFNETFDFYELDWYCDRALLFKSHRNIFCFHIIIRTYKREYTCKYGYYEKFKNLFHVY